MGIAGNLKTMSPADLLQWLSLGQKTGTLVVSFKSVEKKIFFRKGRVISSASNDPREYLGQFLMSHGFISEDELKKAMEVQEQSRILLGKILVTIGAISEPDLIRLMRLKAEEEIYDIFLWKEGEFHFIDNELPGMEMVPLQVDVTGIIMEGTRRVDEWDRIRSHIPTSDMIPIIEKAIDTGALSEVERLVVQCVNGHRNIDQIVLESRSSNFLVSKTLHDFVRKGSIRVVQPAPPPPAALPQKPVPAEPDDEVASLLSRAQSSLQLREFEKALRVLKAAQNLDPNNSKVKNALKGAETVIAAELKKDGLNHARIPQMAKPFEQISSMNFTPNEGFILSRINGQWDVGSIIKISPMRETDALLIFYKLAREGIIEFIDV